MGVEIERKFLVRSDSWRTTSGAHYRQGYLNSNLERVVRVRVIGDKGYLTVKGPNIGAARPEFEYEIPVSDANEMLDNLCEKPLIEKIRHVVEHRGTVWEIDAFLGENEGLVVAEVELQSAEQPVETPDWLGDEVTGDPRYYNSNLVKRPYKVW